MSNSKIISERLPLELIAAIDDVARSQGTTRSFVITTLLKNRLPRYSSQLCFVEHDDAVKFYTALFSVFDEMNAIRSELNKIGVNYNQEVKALNSKNTSAPLNSHSSIWEIELRMNENDKSAGVSSLDLTALDNLIARYEKATGKVDKTLCLIQV